MGLIRSDNFGPIRRRARSCCWPSIFGGLWNGNHTLPAGTATLCWILQLRAWNILTQADREFPKSRSCLRPLCYHWQDPFPRVRGATQRHTVCCGDRFWSNFSTRTVTMMRKLCKAIKILKRAQNKHQTKLRFHKEMCDTDDSLNRRTSSDGSSESQDHIGEFDLQRWITWTLHTECGTPQPIYSH